MYFINKYRKGVPFPKRLLEDSIYRLRWVLNYFRSGKQIKSAFFYPKYPSKQMMLYKVFRYLNYNITNNPKKLRSVSLYWEELTHRSPNDLVLELSKNEHFVNLHCNDISKSRVDEYFTKVFGYSTVVDPEKYTGMIVRKNEINALHDGTILKCPVKKEAGFVYQKLINNVVEDKFAADMRIPVIGGNIPVIFVKYKTLDTRFGIFKKYHHKLKNTEMHAPQALLSEKEIALIIEFCRQFKLEYGELDVLRHLNDGKIYIVDVNNTPTGPPYMDKASMKKSIKLTAEIFAKSFIPATD